MRARDGRDRAGVHPAREIAADGNVADELSRHDLAERRADLLGPFLVAHAFVRLEGEVPVALGAHPVLVGGQRVAGGQEPNAVEERQVAEDVLEREVLVERLR